MNKKNLTNFHIISDELLIREKYLNKKNNYDMITVI